MARFKEVKLCTKKHPKIMVLSTNGYRFDLRAGKMREKLEKLRLRHSRLRVLHDMVFRKAMEENTEMACSLNAELRFALEELGVKI